MLIEIILIDFSWSYFFYQCSS